MNQHMGIKTGLTVNTNTTAWEGTAYTYKIVGFLILIIELD